MRKVGRLRRDLMGAAPSVVLVRIRGRGELMGDEARQLAGEKRAAARAERRAVAHSLVCSPPVV